MRKIFCLLLAAVLLNPAALWGADSLSRPIDAAAVGEQDSPPRRGNAPPQFSGGLNVSAGNELDSPLTFLIKPLTERLAKFLTIPFREDGAVDLEGRWVTFNRQDVFLNTPGFNCSGFTVAAARELLGRDFSLDYARRDRRGDSGPGAELGQDWDFGLDLILNLAEDYPHRFLPEPEDLEAAPLHPMAERPGRALGWGVSLHGPEFEDLIKKINPDNFCFFVFSRPDGRFPAGVCYYHVGVIVPDQQNLWLYHTTLGAKTNRVNLADPAGLARLRRHFQPIKNGERRVFMVEVTPPDLERK